MSLSLFWGLGSALTRSQRGEVAHSFSALPWLCFFFVFFFVKPIDCDRVPSFLWVCLCGGGGRKRYYFFFTEEEEEEGRGAAIVASRGGGGGGGRYFGSEAKRVTLTVKPPSAVCQRWENPTFWTAATTWDAPEGEFPHFLSVCRLRKRKSHLIFSDFLPGVALIRNCS